MALIDARVPRPPRRRALLGAAGVAALAALPACSLLPGRGSGGAPGSSDPSSASSGPSSEPADPWISPADLEDVGLDVTAADERYALAASEVVRRDRYGTWRAPRFPEGGAIAKVEPKVSGDLELAPDVHQGTAAMVLSTAIASLLDSPLALEKGNDRFAEVSPEVVASLPLEGIDPHAFDATFEKNPLNGVFGQDSGAPEALSFEPEPYDAAGTRIHVLEHAVHIEPSRTALLAHGDSVIASVRGAIPVRTESEQDWLLRDISLAMGVGHGGQPIVIAYAGAAKLAVHVADPASLPAVEAAERAPEDWVDQYTGDLTVALPPEFGNEPVLDVGVMLGEPGPDSKGASIIRHRLPAPSPYPVHGGEKVARFTVDGAQLVVASIDEAWGEGTCMITVRVHTDADTYVVQLVGWPTEESRELAAQIVAGIRLR